MSDFSILKALMGDAGAIASVHVRTWQQAYKDLLPGGLLDNLSIERREEIWTRAIEGEEAQVFVADQGGEIVGFCSVGACRDKDLGEEVGEVYAIYVEAENMGKGIGSALLVAGEDFLREVGYEQASLWVLKGNQKTVRWYEKRGWQNEGAEKREFVGDNELIELRYVRKL